MSYQILSSRLLRSTKDILEKQMGCTNEPKMLLYDTECTLADVLGKAYAHNMPNAEIVNMDNPNPEEVRQKLLALPAGSTVILVQSRNFRLNEFRIRLELFHRGVGCLEHTHLGYIAPEEYETYANAIEYRSPYYEELGNALIKKIELAQSIEICSPSGAVLRFGEMEEAKLNHGHFWKQPNRGGGAVCGEVFSEAKDFSTVNGEMDICCYPGEDLRIIVCDPFRVHVEKSIVFCDDPKCPKDFRKNILERIARDENGEVMMREAGFGLNPAISFLHRIADVNAFERMAGFHLSLGKKHAIYRKKFPSSVAQKYHIDVFPDVDKIEIDGIPVFKNGKYCFL